MRLRLIAVGKRMPRWVETGYAEFAKRMPPEVRIELLPIDAGARTAGGDIERARKLEGERILAKVRPGDTVIALDERGTQHTSAQWGQALQGWMGQGRDVCFLIGGPDGLDAACTARADQTWALSAATLPHALVRVVIAEQLYRAWTLVSGHPYHR